METIKAPAASAAQKKISGILCEMTAVGAKSKNVCPVKDVLHNLSDKWSTLAMMVLGQERMLRFNELKSAITGISQKMLTVTLKSLEAHGLIARKMYAQIPPKVEYSITPLGDEYLRHLVVMLDWACTNLSDVTASRKKALKRQAG